MCQLYSMVLFDPSVEHTNRLIMAHHNSMSLLNLEKGGDTCVAVKEKEANSLYLPDHPEGCGSGVFLIPLPVFVPLFFS